LALRAAQTDFSVMLTPAALLAYFAVLIPLALASTRWFERPLQAWLKGKLLVPRPRVPAPDLADDRRGPEGELTAGENNPVH
ncbi:MAG TPA: hypothetical protein VH328_03050, partial [Burkholderiaceae bacterium]|jgi:peptidoglycan/LPS O-acetylase OafA/YrhL|nr:hypothetical protein [Burkholderiaceae bacterium]